MKCNSVIYKSLYLSYICKGHPPFLGGWPLLNRLYANYLQNTGYNYKFAKYPGNSSMVIA